MLCGLGKPRKFSGAAKSWEIPLAQAGRWESAQVRDHLQRMAAGRYPG